MTASTDTAAFLRERLPALVPFVRTLGIEVTGFEPGRATCTLPDRGEIHNHIGGPHAGAMFTLGETASGAIVLAHFGHLLERATPLAVRAEIAYLSVARGDLVAEATLGRSAAEVVAELDGGARPEFPVPVVIRDREGTAVVEMTVHWTLRPNRP